MPVAVAVTVTVAVTVAKDHLENKICNVFFLPLSDVQVPNNKTEDWHRFKSGNMASVEISLA